MHILSSSLFSNMVLDLVNNYEIFINIIMKYVCIYKYIYNIHIYIYMYIHTYQKYMKFMLIINNL